MNAHTALFPVSRLPFTGQETANWARPHPATRLRFGRRSGSGGLDPVRPGLAVPEAGRPRHRRPPLLPKMHPGLNVVVEINTGYGGQGFPVWLADDLPIVTFGPIVTFRPIVTFQRSGGFELLIPKRMSMD